MIRPKSLYIDPANLYIVPMFNREPQTKRATQVLNHIYYIIYIYILMGGRHHENMDGLLLSYYTT